MQNSKFKTVDEYIAAAPTEAQAKLKAIRKAVTQAAPEAQEKISYEMPYYGLGGRLLYFAAHKDHIGFYPMKSAITHFENELAGYRTSAGTVQFPLDKDIDLGLITKITKFRAQENLAKTKP